MLSTKRWTALAWQSRPLPAVMVLAGLRVIEHAEGAAGPLLGRILADLGANVTKVEPLGGDWARRYGASSVGSSGLYEFANAGKRAILVNCRAPSGQELVRRLWTAANCIIIDATSVPLYLTQSSCLPSDCIVVAITPFGLEGEHASWRASPVGVFHAGGGSGVELAAGAHDTSPVAPTGFIAGFDAGVMGAYGVVSILVSRSLGHATPAGPIVLDISNQDVVASLSRQDLAVFANQGVDPGSGYGPLGSILLRCRDGDVSSHMADKDWPIWCDCIDRADLAQDLRFTTRAARTEHSAELVAILEVWTQQKSRAEVELLLQARNVPVAGVLSASEVIEDSQLQRRGFFSQLGDGRVAAALPMTVASTAQRWSPSSRAPRLGEHSAMICHDLGYSPEEVATLYRGAVIL